MPYRDLREFLARLEEIGKLRRIKQKVHWKYEIGAWIRSGRNGGLSIILPDK